MATGSFCFVCYGFRGVVEEEGAEFEEEVMTLNFQFFFLDSLMFLFSSGTNFYDFTGVSEMME
jgi:hypothetical protein